MILIKVKKFGRLPKEQLINLGIVHIDGDQFMLSIPTDEMWQCLLEQIKNDKKNFSWWDDYWFDADAQAVLTQTVFDNELVLHHQFWNMYQPLTDFNRIVSSGDVKKLRGFMPILVPLDKNLEYDHSACSFESEGELSFGGSFYVGGHIKPLAVSSKSIENERMLVYLPWFSSIGIGNAIVKNDDPDCVLPWVQIGGTFLCLRCLITGASLDKIEELLISGLTI